MKASTIHPKSGEAIAKKATKGDRPEKKNILIPVYELEYLRKGVLEQFTHRTGIGIENPEKQFNSNPANYTDLYGSINAGGTLESIGMISHKPLAVLLHFSRKTLQGSVNFRRTFINSIYQYAFGRSREEQLQSTRIPRSPMDIQRLKNIQGYWICYMDKSDRFRDNLYYTGTAQLNKSVYFISGESMGDATYQIFQGKNVATGKVFAKGSNLILKSDENSDELYVVLNCGKHISDFESHIEKGVGCCNYIDETGSPKVGRCVMFYKADFDWENIDHDQFLLPEKFDSNKQLKEERDMEDVKAYFFEETTNTITANLVLYKAAANSSQLLVTKHSLEGGMLSNQKSVESSFPTSKSRILGE